MVINKVHEASTQMGLTINTIKTKTMRISRNPRGAILNFNIDNTILEDVEKYKYLGCWLVKLRFKCKC